MPHIPGLGKQAFVKGSWHQTPTPTLLRSAVSSDRIDFEWSAHGTQVYQVTAKAALCRSDCDSGGVQLEALDVRCSCPDGVKQHLATVVEGKLHVCKHAAAALTAALDPTMGVREVEHAKLREQHRLKQQELMAAERVKQDVEMPGERARIEHGLKNLEADKVVLLIRSGLSTLDGLRAAAVLFPRDVFQPPSIRHCQRCGEDYDLNIPAQRVCRLTHPHDHVSRQWSDSKHSYSECSKCGKTFDLDGYSSFGRKRKQDPYEQGPYCWEGEHDSGGGSGSGDDDDDGSGGAGVGGEDGGRIKLQRR
jgi:hypothetical protein